MTYQALYRKYRPQKFAEVIGQENTVKILKNSIINHKFTHAYLFSGPKGTGKTSIAKILAKTINCLSVSEGEACNNCSNCLFINNNEAIDIIEIDGASNNGVDEIRNIRNNISLLPMNLTYKVYIIDEVHMLTSAAFNALLKTLEEPPKHVIFIFATTEPYKVPVTITSRCQWFEFKKIDHKDTVKILINILQKENIKYEVQALQQLAIIADGSLRDAINSLEKVSNFSILITLKSVIKIFSIITNEKKIAFLVALFNKNISDINAIINEFSDYLNDFKKLLIDLIYVLQEVLIYQLTKEIVSNDFLTKNQLMIFDDVKKKDLKIVLKEFDDLITSNLSNQELKAILLVRIFKLNDKITSNYNLKDIVESNENEQVVAAEQVTQHNDEIIENDSVQTVDNNAVKTVILEQEINEPDFIDPTLWANVLNVIIQANKEERKVVKTAWSKINNLIENNKFRNYSKVYLNTIVSAACEGGIIIVCDNIIQANLINQKLDYQEHRNFLNFILEKEYMLYALDKKQWKLVGKKYQSLLEKNELLVSKKIDIIQPTKVEQTQQESKTLAFLQNIFSDIEEI